MKEFTPIAMRCTREQFDSIKEKLSEFRIIDVYDFKEYEYLINNRFGKANDITNWHNDSKAGENRKVFEKWNEKIFLEACGIKTQPKDPVFIERHNIADKVKELLKECKEQGFSLDIDNGVIILKQI